MFPDAIKTLARELADVTPERNWTLAKRPDVLHCGGRAYTVMTSIEGQPCVRKVFCRNRVARRFWRKEIVRAGVFRDYPWHTEILAQGTNWKGQPYFVTPRYREDQRLDRLASHATPEQRQRLGLECLLAVLDMHGLRIAHRDLHAKNLFATTDGIRVIDFETSTEYPEDYNPGFADCYDLRGTGLESPLYTDNMGFFKNHPYSVSGVLRLDEGHLFRALQQRLEDDLDQALEGLADRPLERMREDGAAATGMTAARLAKRMGAGAHLLVWGGGACDLLKTWRPGARPRLTIVEPDPQRRILLRRWVALFELGERIRLVAEPPLAEPASPTAAPFDAAILSAEAWHSLLESQPNPAQERLQAREIFVHSHPVRRAAALKGSVDTPTLR